MSNKRTINEQNIFVNTTLASVSLRAYRKMYCYNKVSTKRTKNTYESHIILVMPNKLRTTTLSLLR